MCIASSKLSVAVRVPDGSLWLSAWLNWNYWGITVHLWSREQRCFQKDLTGEELEWAASSHSLGSQDKKKERGESQPNANIHLSASCSTQVWEVLATCFCYYKVTCHYASLPCWTRSTQTVRDYAACRRQVLFLPEARWHLTSRIGRVTQGKPCLFGQPVHEFGRGVFRCPIGAWFLTGTTAALRVDVSLWKARWGKHWDTDALEGVTALMSICGETLETSRHIGLRLPLPMARLPSIQPSSLFPVPSIAATSPSLSSSADETEEVGLENISALGKLAM